MHMTTSNLLAAAAAATCGQGSDCQKQRPLGDEHPESGQEEHLVAQKFPQVEEAGSIVLQFSRNSSVTRSKDKEKQGTTYDAATKKDEKC